MSGLFGIIETGKQALFTQQSVLQILNHNIANAATPGYSRQRVLLGARTTLGNMGWPSGDGVQVLGVQRISDGFMVSRLGRAQADLGTQTALVEGFDLIELALGEPANDTLGDSTLGDSISAFLDSWQVALNPENGEGSGNITGIILESADLLARRFGDLAAELGDQSTDLRRQLQADLREINSLLDEVAHYNEDLAGSALSESGRSNIIDARERALMSLSTLTGADWEEGENGLVTVRVGSHTLVDGITASRIEGSVTDTGGRMEGFTLSIAGAEAGMSLAGGEIKGRLELLNEHLPDLAAKLDSLAAGIIERINEIHQAADGAAGGGIDIFTGEDASSMALSTVLKENPDLLSTAGTLPDGRDIARAIFDLHFENVDQTDGLTLEDFYAGMVGQLGAKSASARQLGISALNMAQGIQDRVESVSGVSLDEELANMMMVQAAFAASSRVITVVDEMLDAILATT